MKAGKNRFNPAILPLTGFAVYIFLRPLLDGLTHYNLQLLFQLAVTAAAAVYAGLILLGRARYRPTGLEAAALLFLAVNAISAAVSTSPYRSTRLFLEHLHYFLLFFLLVQMLAAAGERGERFSRVLRAVILASGILVCLYALEQYFWGFRETLGYLKESNLLATTNPDLLARLYSRRVFSTFVYPNILAGYLIALLPVAISLGSEAGADRRTLAALLSLLLLTTLGLTRSTGAMAALGITGLLWLAAAWSGRRARARTGTPDRLQPAWLVPVLTLAGGLIGLWLILRAAGLWTPLLGDKAITLRDRLAYWSSSWRMFLREPVLGFGPGSFGVHYTRFKIMRALETQHSHSLFFEMLAENGLLGTGAFLAFWALLLRRIAPRMAGGGAAAGLGWGAIALFVHAQLDFDFSDPSLASFLFILPALIPVRSGRPDGRPDRAGSSNRPWLTRLGAGLIILIMVAAGIRQARLYRADRIFQNGLTELSQGTGRPGLESLHRAAGMEPDNPHYWAQLADLYFQAGRFGNSTVLLEKAVENYRRAVRVEPFASGYHYRLGLASEDLAGRTGQAVWKRGAATAFRRAAELYPDNPNYRQKNLPYHTPGNE